MCNCRSGQVWWRPADRRPVARVPQPVPQQPRRMAAPPMVRPQNGGSGGFCPLCGWAIKEAFYVNRGTGQMIKKTACSNKSCQRSG